MPLSLDDSQNANHIQSNYKIQLTDFGTGEQWLSDTVDLTSIGYSAAMVDGPHADIIQPYALRAPEVILGNGWHTSADIWNLGCLVSKSSFQLLNNSTFCYSTTDDDNLLVIWISHRKMAIYPTERAHMERWKLSPCSYAHHCRGRIRSYIQGLPRFASAMEILFFEYCINTVKNSSKSSYAGWETVFSDGGLLWHKCSSCVLPSRHALDPIW